MAGKLRFARKKAPARYRARRRRQPNLTRSAPLITKNISVFPEKYRFQGKWLGIAPLTSHVDTYKIGAVHTYNLANIFEPAVGTATHAMLGKDELSLLYKKYKVDKVGIKITFSNPSSDGQYMIWQYCPTNTVSVVINGSNFGDTAEKTDVEWCALNNTGSQVKVIKKVIPMYKLFNMTKQQYEANMGPNFYGTMTAGGPTSPQLVIGTMNTDGASKSVTYAIELTFYGVAYERRKMLLSDNS